MEESYFLQASLDSSDRSSDKRSMPEATMSPYYMKSITPSAYEATLRQKEGELASYMSRLVGVKKYTTCSFLCNSIGRLLETGVEMGNRFTSVCNLRPHLG